MDRSLRTGVLGLGIGLLLGVPIQFAVVASSPGQATPPAGRGRGMVFTEPIASHGQPQSLRLVLPALSCLLLKPVAESPQQG